MVRLSSRNAAHFVDRLLGHWLLAAAMILIAAALAMPQLDKYTLSLDSINSFLAAGLSSTRSFSLQDSFEYLQVHSPDQLPFYFWILNITRFLSGSSEAVARMPAVWFGLLSLAMVYRLGRDLLAPAAGSFAMLLLLSNAFYAFYFAQARYYTLLVFLAALTIWLYLRIAQARHLPSWKSFVALSLACLALITTHAFSSVICVLLAMYHLLTVRQDRRWLWVILAAAIALAFASPFLVPMLTAGREFAQAGHGPNRDDAWQLFRAWATVLGNGSPFLLALSGLGLILGWRLRLLSAHCLWLLFPLMLLSAWICTQLSGIVSVGQMRYLLVTFPVALVFAAGGLYAWYRWRMTLGLLILLWLVAGLAYMQAADWELLIQGRTWAYTHPPWHLISRWMQQSGEKLPAMTFGVPHEVLRTNAIQPFHLMNYYFGQHGFSMQDRGMLDIDARIGGNALEQPGYWILFQQGVTEPKDMAIVAATLDKYGYEACAEETFPNDTLLVTYRWKSLNCDAQPKANYAIDAGAYLHYGAVHDETKLLFSGAWIPEDADPDAHNISFQLLDTDWGSQAQIDLPTSSLSDKRQLIFDLADLRAGDYRLMAVVYAAQTGERLAWRDNADWIPEMQQLAQLTIPERAAEETASN